MSSALRNRTPSASGALLSTANWRATTVSLAFTHFHLPLINISKGIVADRNRRQVGRPRRYFDIQIQRCGGIALDRAWSRPRCRRRSPLIVAPLTAWYPGTPPGKVLISRCCQFVSRRQVDPEQPCIAVFLFG